MSADDDYKKSMAEMAAAITRLEKSSAEHRADMRAMREESDAKFEQIREENDRRDRKFRVKMHQQAQEWGDLAEYLAQTGLKELINQYTALEVDDLIANVEVVRGDKKGEIDIIAIGKRDVVVVETKTTLRSNEVKSFKKKYLPSFPYWKPKSKYIVLPDCRNKRVFGCVTFLKAKKDAEQTALDLGLLVVRTLGKKIQLINADDTNLIDYNAASRRK